MSVLPTIAHDGAGGPHVMDKLNGPCFFCGEKRSTAVWHGFVDVGLLDTRGLLVCVWCATGEMMKLAADAAVGWLAKMPAKAKVGRMNEFTERAKSAFWRAAFIANLAIECDREAVSQPQNPAGSPPTASGAGEV